MSNEKDHEITGFIHFNKMTIVGVAGTILINITGEHRKRDKAKPDGKVHLSYDYNEGAARRCSGTGSAKPIPQYTIDILRKNMAYLANMIRSRFTEFSDESQGIEALNTKFEIGFVINEVFELRTSVLPRKISGTKAPDGTAAGDQSDDRWAIE